MKFGVVFNQLGLVFAMLLYCAKAVPMDADSAALMMAQVGGAVLDMAQEVNPQMDMNKKIVAGPLAVEGGASFKAKDESERRKRSVYDDDVVLPQGETHRHKRSPCSGRRRQRTTEATPSNGNSENNNAGNGNGSNGGSDDLPRRRKRSPQDNDIDENIEAKPMQKSFGEGLQDMTRKMEQFFKNFTDKMAEIVENIMHKAKAAGQDESQ